MSKLVLSLIALFGLLVATTTVEARPSRGEGVSTASENGERRAQRVKKVRKAHSTRYARRSTRSHRSYRTARSRSGGEVERAAYIGGSFNAGPRPGRWCGWWMRTQLGGGPEYNLARNWRNYGSPTTPRVGAVVVWPHHVGIITGQAPNGQWIVKSGNDGGRVRERARSVAGAVFRI
jgi:hypothetical protein